MGQIEDLVESFKVQDALFKDFEIDNIVKTITEHINNCDSLPIGDKIKALSFLYNKCDYILNSIASFMNYQLEYEPTDDEVWDFVEQEKKRIDINSDDLSQYENCIIDSDGYDGDGYFDESRLYEYVIDPMREQYREKNKDVSQWCDKIYDLQKGIYIEISKEKSKESFFKEALKEAVPAIKTTIDEYLFGCNIEAIKPKLFRLLRGEKGRNVAITLIALDRLEYINLDKLDVTVLFKILQSEFGIAGARSTLDTALAVVKRNNEDPKNVNAISKDMEILRQ